MPNATNYLKSNLLNAASIPPDVKIQAVIVSVRDREFEDGEIKLVLYVDYLGKGIVCNVTRLTTMIEAYGTDYDGWVGKTIIISLGEKKYEGRKVGAVKIEPVVADRIGAEQRPALEAQPPRRPDIRSGRDAWDGPKRTWEGPPAPPITEYDGPDEGEGPDDDI